MLSQQQIEEICKELSQIQDQQKSLENEIQRKVQMLDTFLVVSKKRVLELNAKLESHFKQQTFQESFKRLGEKLNEHCEKSREVQPGELTASLNKLGAKLEEQKTPVLFESATVKVQQILQYNFQRCTNVFNKFVEDTYLSPEYYRLVDDANAFITNKIWENTPAQSIQRIVHNAIETYINKEDFCESKKWLLVDFFEAISKEFNLDNLDLSKKLNIPTIEQMEQFLSGSNQQDDEFVTYTYKFSNPEKVRFLKEIEICPSNPSLIRMLEKESNKVKMFKREGLVIV